LIGLKEALKRKTIGTVAREFLNGRYEIEIVSKANKDDGGEAWINLCPLGWIPKSPIWCRKIRMPILIA
jgi:hypothetical protein